MGGKVVLIDFWATWCGPCKEALPEIQRIAKDFAGQPLVVISISSDRDDIAWKSFVEKHAMTWPQYRDANGALSNAYGVSSIPRYFTIDTDGALKSVKVGSDADVAGDIKRLVKKAQDAEKKKAKDSDHAATGE
jgi:thiol-disulfide isomerase/thioredoxin